MALLGKDKSRQPPAAYRRATVFLVAFADAGFETSVGRAMIGPVSSVHKTKKTIQRNSMIGTPERPAQQATRRSGQYRFKPEK
jgi:hypothetical protein